MCSPACASYQKNYNLLLVNHETSIHCWRDPLCQSSFQVLLSLRLSLPPGQDVLNVQDPEDPSTGFSPAPATVARRGETNRCSGLEDMSLFARGSVCGPPLTQPCFDFKRCATTSGFYVHDAHCCELRSSSGAWLATFLGFAPLFPCPLFFASCAKSYPDFPPLGVHSSSLFEYMA